ncbi:MAG: nicotinamide mononucleotide transporter [Sedimentisphaerales bacterium]|nr:nicotinamide mononucleotide transporter [Sedimentisphaerales bacterium]
MWLTSYYGVDWVAMIFTLTAIYLLGNKNKTGFISMMIGNGCWAIFGILTHSYALIVANAIFFIMNIRGFIRWKKTTDTPSKESTMF